MIYESNSQNRWVRQLNSQLVCLLLWEKSYYKEIKIEGYKKINWRNKRIYSWRVQDFFFLKIHILLAKKSMRSISRLFFLLFFFLFAYSICDLLDLLYKEQVSLALKSSIHTTMKWLCLSLMGKRFLYIKDACSHVGEGKNVLCLIFV